MWVMVMFDLPVMNLSERKAASLFRNDLLDMGFQMTQLSVYVRFCGGKSHAETFCKKVESILPKGGKVNILQFTDKQYEKIISYHGKNKKIKNKTPNQFNLF
tara:strand:+ start:425 stop:730 length:306 start_codon:yes stop_codon:yes gene_type:complete